MALACICRGILVMVDGAQTLGNIDIDITSYGADFYVTNCHKWFCNTRGSALTYVRRELQPQIKPLVVSWGHQKGFAAEFIFSGMSDTSGSIYLSLLCLYNDGTSVFTVQYYSMYPTRVHLQVSHNTFLWESPVDVNIKHEQNSSLITSAHNHIIV